MEQKNKPVEQMNFQELWDYLREQSKNKFLYKLKAKMMSELEMTDATLRYRKRRMLFTKLERKALTELLKEYTENPNIKEDVLFPNNIERFANDYYKSKQKETA